MPMLARARLTCNTSTCAGGAKGDGGRQEDRSIRRGGAGKVAERFGDASIDDLGELFDLLALSADRGHDRCPSSAFPPEPVKLPVLNVELPLWGFFWLAPGPK
jgi:hypothetical protein